MIPLAVLQTVKCSQAGQDGSDGAACPPPAGGGAGLAVRGAAGPPPPPHHPARLLRTRRQLQVSQTGTRFELKSSSPVSLNDSFVFCSCYDTRKSVSVTVTVLDKSGFKMTVLTRNLLPLKPNEAQVCNM